MTTAPTREPRLLAARAHAISDPTRAAILARLASGEHCVCDLVDLLGAAQSRLSFHLRVLRDAGLVRARAQGRWMHYRLAPDALDEVAAALAAWADAARNAPEEGCRCCPSP